MRHGPMRFDSANPYVWRTRIRQYLPWFLIDLGVCDKGLDCEAVGGTHEWFNHDNKTSGCYHCKATGDNRLWERPLE